MGKTNKTKPQAIKLRDIDLNSSMLKCSNQIQYQNKNAP